MIKLAWHSKGGVSRSIGRGIQEDISNGRGIKSFGKIKWAFPFKKKKVYQRQMFVVFKYDQGQVGVVLKYVQGQVGVALKFYQGQAGVVLKTVGVNH